MVGCLIEYLNYNWRYQIVIRNFKMSIYFSVLFILLVAQMAFMFMIVMPLHYQIRKRLVVFSDNFLSGPQFRTVVAILSCLVILLFIDSWKRAQLPVFSHAEKPQDVASSLKTLTTRAYNQRNVYISGFILYFTICIPVLLNLLTRLVKYETLIRELNSVPAVENKQDEKDKNKAKEKEVASPQLTALQKELESKKVSLKALKIQINNLNEHFDATIKDKDPQPASEKKND